MSKKTKALIFTSALAGAASAAALWLIRKQKQKELIYRLELSGTTEKGKPVDAESLTAYLETLGQEQGFAVSGGKISIEEDKGFVFFFASSGPLPLADLGEQIKTKFNLASCSCKLEK